MNGAEGLALAKRQNKIENINPDTKGVYLCLILPQILYTGIVIYAPALALNQGIQLFKSTLIYISQTHPLEDT